MGCHSCNADVPGGSRFCNMCGVRLDAVETGRAQAAATGTVAAKKVSGGSVSGTLAGAATVTAVAEKPVNRPPTRDERVELCLKKILKQKDVPAFQHHIFEVMSVVGNDEATLQQLTNTILRDYSLSLVVLRRANSAYYNRSSKRICSVARAVTLMGVEAIRSIAGSLMLFEHYQRHSPGLKELMLLSLLTASHARQVTGHLRMPRAEEAYLSGMFRNLGEVLVACHMGEEYTQILREMQENRVIEKQACLKVLKFTFEELGRGMARNWKMPESVMQMADPDDEEALGRSARRDLMGTLVAFSHELTSAVYRRNPKEGHAAINLLIDKFGATLRFQHDEVRALLAAAVAETKETFAALGVPLDDLQLRNQAKAALAGRALGVVEEIPELKMEETETETEESLLDRLAAEVEAATQPDSEVGLNDLVMMVLEAYQRGASFERVVFCLANPERTELRGRLGLGQSIGEVIAQVCLPLVGREELLTTSLLTKKDLFVENRRNSRYRTSFLVQELKAESFGLFPIVVEGIVVGCFYFDNLQPTSKPEPKVLGTLGRMRDLMAEVIRRNRAAA